MRPANENVQGVKHNEILIQREIGLALRQSFEAMMLDPLPSQIAMLLMQLALAEMMRGIADEEQETRQ